MAKATPKPAATPTEPPVIIPEILPATPDTPSTDVQPLPTAAVAPIVEPVGLIDAPAAANSDGSGAAGIDPAVPPAVTDATAPTLPVAIVPTDAADPAPISDATNNADADAPDVVDFDAEPVESPPPVTIDDVLADLAAHDGRHGHLTRSPTLKLNAEQARTQSHLYDVLVARGVKLKRQSDVYGWLLSEIAAAVKPD